MNVAFLNAAGTADTDKFRFDKKVVDSSTTGQPDTETQSAHLLMEAFLQTSFIRYAAFDAFRHQFINGVVNLEIPI